jgi:prepilin-type N-terminal cleavage/methylation domain-containing protein
MRRKRNVGTTLIELLVVIAILGIFMGIAIPSVIKSSHAMEQAKRLTARYPNAHRALDQISNTLRQTYPAALAMGESFVGQSESYEAGGISLPLDRLSFPILDTKYAHLRSVQRISYELEKNTEPENVPMALMGMRSFLDAPADKGIKETVLGRVVGLDFRYLDDSTDPPQWISQWPPESANEIASDAKATRPDRVPQAVEITIFMLGEISARPKSFSIVVNVPSR